jgi:radical SAM-linked protein
MLKDWVVMKYEKISPIIFIGHLDLLHCIQRAIRVSNLPIAYSEGFNPHMKLVFPSPLSLGISGSQEFLLAQFSEPISLTELLKINHNLPNGIKLIKASALKVSKSTFVNSLFGFNYEIKFSSKTEAEEMKQYLESLDEIDIKTKKGIQQRNAKEHINNISSKANSLYFFLKFKEANNLNIKNVITTISAKNSNIQSITRLSLRYH